MDHRQAVEALQTRMRERDDSFLVMMRRLVYERPTSPYRALLLHAGWNEPALESSVRTHGVEGTLERLLDSGVYVTFEELKGRRPIVRGTFTLDVADADFDNPFMLGKGIGGTTSGSTARPRRVAFDWAGLTEEAASNVVLREMHGFASAPLALWLPLPPGIAGVHSLLVNAKMAQPPERWFSPVQPGMPGSSLIHRYAARYLVWAGRRAGMRLPYPEPLPLADAHIAAQWLFDARERHGSTSALRTSASTGVRVAEAAIARGIDVAGCAILVGGEPLTEARSRAIEAAGLRAVPRYASAELGLMAGLCGEAQSCDDMHVYLDRLAVIGMPRPLGPDGATVDSLMFTSLSLNCSKVFLNADLGDHASLERRSCGCTFGKVGMDLHASRVRSHDKLTGEGMGLLASQLDDAVSTVVGRAGGGPNDYQFWERTDERGFTKLVLAVSPDVAIDEATLVSSVLDELRSGTAAEALTSEIWRQAGTLELVRARPASNYKMPPIIRR